MTTLFITYATEPNPTAPYWTWGHPEDTVHELLSDHGHDVTAYDAGTDLLTGERDVQMVTDADPDTVRALLAPLDHAHHWKVTP